MKFRQGFRLREICGEKIVVAEGLDMDFNKMLHLNDSAALLWNEYYGREFEVSDLASTLVDSYGIDLEVAVRDAGALADSWKEAGVIEGFGEAAPVQENAGGEAEGSAGAEDGNGSRGGFFSRLFGRRR